MPTEQNINEVKRWLLKKLNGTIEESEKAKLDAWMKQSPANEALARRILSAAFLKQAILDKNRLTGQARWNALRKQIGYARHPHIARWGKIAALITVVLASAWMFTYYLQRYADSHRTPVTILAGSTKALLYDNANDSVYRLPETAGYVFELSLYNQLVSVPKNKNTASTCRSISVPRGGEYQVRLTDSTSIHLGPESTLDIPLDFSCKNRQVRICGQAFIAVHPDAAHPFTIQAPGVNVRVTGTRLNIEAYPDEPNAWVSLEKGKVELQTPQDSLHLPVGLTAVIGQDRHIALTTDSLAEHTSWHYSRMVFYARTMEDIMKKLSRWYDINVEFENDGARNSRITMDVNKYETFNQLTNDIEKMNELQIKIKDRNKVLISERNLE